MSADPITFARGVIAAATSTRLVAYGPYAGVAMVREFRAKGGFGRDVASVREPSDARAIALAVNTHGALLDVLAFAAKRGSTFGECCYCDSTEEAHEDDCPIGRALAAIGAEMERQR